VRARAAREASHHLLPYSICSHVIAWMHIAKIPAPLFSSTGLAPLSPLCDGIDHAWDPPQDLPSSTQRMSRERRCIPLESLLCLPAFSISAMNLPSPASSHCGKDSSRPRVWSSALVFIDGQPDFVSSQRLLRSSQRQDRDGRSAPRLATPVFRLSA
jgi:hypothetical protein